MRREANISVILDCGDDPMPSDRTLAEAIERALEGETMWAGAAKVIAGRFTSPTVIIDSAKVTLGEVTAP